MELYIVINHYILDKEIEELALQAIDSFRRTCHGMIISVDDCSPWDMTKIREKSDIFIKTKTNLGFAGSANVGLQYFLDNFTGDVVYANNDIEVNPGWYEEFCRLRTITGANMLGGLGYRSKEHHLAPRQKFSEGGRLEDWMFPGGFFMTDDVTLREVGIYDPEYEHGGVEDIDLFYRMKLAHKKLIMVGTVTYWHKEGATRYSATQKGKNHEAEKRNLAYFKAKWGFDALPHLYSRILLDNRINL